VASNVHAASLAHNRYQLQAARGRRQKGYPDRRERGIRVVRARAYRLTSPDISGRHPAPGSFDASSFQTAMTTRAPARPLAVQAGSRRLPRRRRIRLDAFETLTLGLALVAVVLAAVFGTEAAGQRVVPRTITFLVVQYLVGRFAASTAGRFKRAHLQVGRLAVAVVFVAVLTVGAGEGGRLPLTSLYLPIVAMAAATGRFQTMAISAAVIAAYVVVELLTGAEPTQSGIRGVALGGAAALLVFGTHKTIGAMHSALAATRAARRGERRRASQMSGIEQVGRVLAHDGPTPAALDRLLDVLTGGFGYRHVSIYFTANGGLTLGAQRGYADPIERFEERTGVMGRVLRTRDIAWVPDVRTDPDYRAADAAIRSEISAPLLDRGTVIGILNVESTADRPLDEADVRLVAAVADRLAIAVALASERKGLADRVASFAALIRFSAAISRLETADIYGKVLDAVAEVVPADLVTLTVLDPKEGRYLVRGVRAPNVAIDRLVGKEIELGEGMAGRALRDRVLARGHDYGPESFPRYLQDDGPAARYADALGVPVIRDGVAIGALTLGRSDPERPFTLLEIEALELLAGQTALAISNALLHEEVAALAIQDGLTGLYNRRHFDAAFEHLLATHERHHADGAHGLSVILFDLDHFGQFNKEHGHQVGDDVLRRFADVLRSRARVSDLVARYGGEEFVVVLDGADQAAAVSVANEVRLAFGAGETAGSDGTALRATVSAGVSTLGDEPTREALVRAADVGLYMAKRAGRDRVVAA
jgi:diguanylate cyclase (GGDEF)-like protein